MVILVLVYTILTKSIPILVRAISVCLSVSLSVFPFICVHLFAALVDAIQLDIAICPYFSICPSVLFLCQSLSNCA